VVEDPEVLSLRRVRSYELYVNWQQVDLIGCRNLNKHVMLGTDQTFFDVSHINNYTEMQITLHTQLL